jgi:hypothetical protein
MLMMLRHFWKRNELAEDVIPPVLVGVPGSMLGIEVPFLPRPGRLHIIPFYDTAPHTDVTSLGGMRWACCIEHAA